jgi:glycosyltransferase involved in cell wall biosynthesis
MVNNCVSFVPSKVDVSQIVVSNPKKEGRMGQKMEKERAREERNSSNKIVIGLCTYYGNELLDDALKSLSRIDLPADVEVWFVLVYNDPDGRARRVFKYYADICPFNARYFVEPNEGMVCARNGGLEEARKLGATEIAVFHDDEIIVANWLAAF